eukprot:UN11361
MLSKSNEYSMTFNIGIGKFSFERLVHLIYTHSYSKAFQFRHHCIVCLEGRSDVPIMAWAARHLYQDLIGSDD